MKGFHTKFNHKILISDPSEIKIDLFGLSNIYKLPINGVIFCFYEDQEVYTFLVIL